MVAGSWVQTPRAENYYQLPVTFSMTFRVIRVESPKTSNWTCAAPAIRGAIMHEHCLTIADHCGSSSPPRRRLLARRPLDLCLSLRAQTLAADHRNGQCKQYNNGSVVAVLLPSLWIRLISFFREHSNTNLKCGNILESVLAP